MWEDSDLIDGIDHSVDIPCNIKKHTTKPNDGEINRPMSNERWWDGGLQCDKNGDGLRCLIEKNFGPKWSIAELCEYDEFEAHF